MARIDEQLTEQFRKWELRGRGWQMFDEPVYPEPPFVPFEGRFLPDEPVVDDGRRPTFLSSLVENLSRKLSTEPRPLPPIIPEREEEPEPASLSREPLVELQTSLPAKLDISPAAFAQFLRNLALCREPVAFELLGLPRRVLTQFAAHPGDAPLVRRQLQAYFPEAVFQPQQGTLENAWINCDGTEVLAVEFGLEREFMFPLASGKIDPFIGIVGALSELQSGELGLFQVLFQPVSSPWAESITSSVTHADGRPFFVNVPELASAAEAKVGRALYAAVVRIAAQTDTWERTLQLAQDLAGSLRVFSHPQGNALIPLSNDDYPFDDHIQDVLLRQSRRSGMLLNSDELIGFVHLPSSAVRSPALQRDTGKTKAAPSIARNATGLLLGNNVHFGESISVRLSPEQRVRHCHIIGASGTGKSTLLFNLIRQDIEGGQGVAVLDPHGDLIDRILGVIPPDRIADVILIDPSDEEYSVGFNILSAHSDLEKNLLASDLVSIFQRLSTSWGDQMGSVLQNAILAILESDQGGTLADMRRFLIEPAFREKFLKTVRDPDVVYYWRKAFPQLSGNRSIGPVLTRLGDFLAPKPVRYMVSQLENRLDFAEIMDSGKIFLAKLPHGQMGKENSFLLGSLLVTKFQQLVMGRQARRIESRRPFWLYIDEFQHFITPSMAEILSGARKYGLGLILAHQELQHLERNQDVKSAVLSNCYTRVVFRVGDADARALEGGLSFFTAKELLNLENYHAICRVEKADGDFNLSVPCPEDPDPAQAEAIRQAVIAASRQRYATSRREIEAKLLAKLNTEDEAPEKAKAASTSPLAESRLAKPAEVPKATDSEKEKPAAPLAEATPVRPVAEVQKPSGEPTVPHEPAPARALGRGGEQHKAIQERLQAEAHALGFLAKIDGQLVEGSNEAADLVLRRDNVSIAVEISVTTTTDHEFGNVKKCLAAGFSRVAVVSHRPEHLKTIAAAVEAGLGSEVAGKVRYHAPDEFIAELRKLAAETAAQPVPPTPPGERTIRGYKVKRSGPVLQAEEHKSKEAAAIRIIAEAMKAGG